MNLLECFKVKHGITLNIIINLIITQMKDAHIESYLEICFIKSDFLDMILTVHLYIQNSSLIYCSVATILIKSALVPYFYEF